MSAHSLTQQPEAQSGAPAGLWQRLRGYLLHRIWLPQTVYRAIPWIYMANGSACLAGVLYLPDRTWLWPYIVLLGLGCFHAAHRVLGARRS